MIDYLIFSLLILLFILIVGELIGIYIFGLPLNKKFENKLLSFEDTDISYKSEDIIIYKSKQITIGRVNLPFITSFKYYVMYSNKAIPRWSPLHKKLNQIFKAK